MTSPLAGPVAVAADGDDRRRTRRRRPRSTTCGSGRRSRTRSAARLTPWRTPRQVGDHGHARPDARRGAGTVDPVDPQPNHGLPNLDHYRMYDAWLALHTRARRSVRLQMNFLHNQGFILSSAVSRTSSPSCASGCKNQFQFFGDDMLQDRGDRRMGGAVRAPGHQPRRLRGLVRGPAAGRAGAWRNENAQSTARPTSSRSSRRTRRCDAEFGITDLRWGLQHGDLATEDQLARLKALNVGLSMSGLPLAGQSQPDGAPVGPLFPRSSASGINAGHARGRRAHRPAQPVVRPALRDHRAQLVRPADQPRASRSAARRRCTRTPGATPGTSTGRTSSARSRRASSPTCVVLDRDYFRVSDDEMRRTQPVLTVVGGTVVHNTGDVQ